MQTSRGKKNNSRSEDVTNCPHNPENWQIESVQVDYWPTPDIDSSYDVDVYVCGDCDETIPYDLADPAQDAYDAMVDAQIDMMRGK